jgi:hypothetical protein
MDYKQKYLKYKQKYIVLQNIIYHTRLLSGGAGPILPWFPMRSNQLYIEAVIDNNSHLGKEISTRLTKIGVINQELHISLLEILIPEMRQNVGPGGSQDNKIDLYIKAFIQTVLKNNIKDIYNNTLGNLLAYSAKDNYECYGKFFVRKYDDIKFAKYIRKKFMDFKIQLIHDLIHNSSFGSDFNTLIHRPLVKLQSTSDPSKPPILTKDYTHYYQKGILNCLTSPLPKKGSGENTSLFAISEYFDTTDLDPAGGLIGWIPHISITNDPNACSKKAAFTQAFKQAADVPISYLPFWKSSVKRPRPDYPTQTMDGSISKLIIKYADIIEEIDL